MTNQRHSCNGCGRLLAGTTTEPYWTVRDENGQRWRYWYLRRHNRPNGSRCDSDVSGGRLRALR